jgi:hypothetical protein
MAMGSSRFFYLWVILLSCRLFSAVLFHYPVTVSGENVARIGGGALRKFGHRIEFVKDRGFPVLFDGLL